MNNALLQQLQAVKEASYELNILSTEPKNAILQTLAQELRQNEKRILEANQRDMGNFDSQSSLYDRALLTSERILAMAQDIETVISLADPVGEILEEKTLPNGLELSRVRVPFGVMGMVYEARPNVTIDAASLCIKSGNAVMLRGSANCYESNKMLVSIIQNSLQKNKCNPAAVQLMDPARELVSEMLTAEDFIDVIIPRGGQDLIRMVREKASIPVIETGAGVVHIYVDEYADPKKAGDIIYNAKTQRPSVCNSMDTLILHQALLPTILSQIAPLLAEKQVTLFADSRSLAYLSGRYPESLLKPAGPEHFGHEFLSLTASIKVVSSFEEALEHLRLSSSGHTEAIISEDRLRQERFLKEVDAAVVMVNASTRFTDGAQFGLGAEIGISTQKLHARGPMGLREMTSYKWLVRGNGQTRP